jgi:hypothetical protein
MLISVIIIHYIIHYYILLLYIILYIIIHNYGCYDVFYKYWSILKTSTTP